MTIFVNCLYFIKVIFVWIARILYGILVANQEQIETVIGIQELESVF